MSRYTMAATVNGAEITVAEVESLSGSTFDEAPGPFNQALNTLVAWEITEDAANDEYAYQPTDDEVEEQLGAVLAGAGFESVEAMAEAQGVATDTIELPKPHFTIRGI